MRTATRNIFSIAALTLIFSFNTVSAGEWVKVIVMGESGHAVEFPMTAEEITAVNAENARLAAIRAARPNKSELNVVGFEMAESGQSIEFPVTVPTKKLDLGDGVIARDTSGNAAARVR